MPFSLPTDHPFTATQAPFVEGFVNALQAIRDSHAAAAAAADTTGAPLTILYGSQSGNGEALAKQLRNVGRRAGFDPAVKAMDDFGVDGLADVEHALFICSTFGEGDPPDNAMQFMQGLRVKSGSDDSGPNLSHLHYSVLALGDRSYTHFCKAGTDLDEALHSLGANRLTDCVLSDVDVDEPFAVWSKTVFESEPMTAVAGEAPIGLLEEEAAVGDRDWSKQNPFPATLLRCYTLNQPGSAKEVNHVELSLAGSGFEGYEVGDALGLWPVNCFHQVQQILDAGGFTGEETVAVKGVDMPLRTALLKKLDLNVLTPVVKEKLGLDLDDAYLSDHQILDVLLDFVSGETASAVRPTPQALVDALRPLQPRLYSISSSPKMHPGQVHLTVGAVRYHLHDRDRTGVASCYLADRCTPGSTVGVYLVKAPHFRPPADPATPMIMVGPGTGIAPFRAFLEDRIAATPSSRAEDGTTTRPGPSWLFFGDQHAATDYLYAETLERWKDDGKLAKLSLAWSRDGDVKEYVQHKMLQEGAELWDWLERGAHFYICGDAKRMAHDVDAALKQVVAEHGNMSPENADAYVQQLVADHRYQRDVY